MSKMKNRRFLPLSALLLVSLGAINGAPPKGFTSLFDGVTLNAKTIVTANLDRWTTPEQNPDGSKNKFKTALKDLPRAGHIGFQDHGHNVWFRNVYLKEL